MDPFTLRAGDAHYTAYVGPPSQYDFMGATQFRLLTTLGLRASHFLLDFGCGSLRAGRLFITYLDEGRYFGVEPNSWLIEDAIKGQVGEDLIALKKPQFDGNQDFRVDVFRREFDFILAQSIFSHTGRNLIASTLAGFKDSLTYHGIVVATFVEGSSDFEGDGWIYPGCVRYRPSTIKRFAREAGLFICRLPWYHPRQGWYILTRDRRRTPTRAMLRHLSGAVLFDPEFRDSWHLGRRIRGKIGRYIRPKIPRAVKRVLKYWSAAK